MFEFLARLFGGEAPEEERVPVGLNTATDWRTFLEALAEERDAQGLPAYTYEQAIEGKCEYCGICRDWFTEVHIH